MSLSVENINTIGQIVSASPISRQAMVDDLIDHLCCAVEEKMERGVAFTVALETSLHDLAPRGFGEIEIETYFLLNQNTVTMKKFTYASGLFFSICASLSLIFKIIHLKGANELLLIGFGGLAVVFAPMLMVVRYSEGKSKMEKTRDIIFLFSAMLISMGAIFKLCHLPGAHELLLVGIVVFSLGYLPLQFLKMYKESVAI
jgi:hypothetical protein